MKVKPNYMLRDLGSQHLVVPVGVASRDFHGFVRLNASGAFLWGLMQEPQTPEELALALVEKYGITKEQAGTDVAAFLDQVADFIDA